MEIIEKSEGGIKINKFSQVKIRTSEKQLFNKIQKINLSTHDSYKHANGRFQS